jgi:hypothetical protein
MTPEELNLIEQESAPGVSSGISEQDLSEVEGGSATFEPTMGEKAGEVGVGTLQGLKTGLTTLGPAFKGAQYGFRLGAPFSPYAGVAGGVAGFVGGFMAGSEISDYLDDFFPLPNREDLIPYREGGKTFSESASALPYAFGIPKMSGTLLERFVSGIGETARKYPVTFSTTELLGSAGAGVGGGTAEYTDPGDAGTRALYEITGGLLAPGKLFVNAGTTVYDFGKQLVAGQKLDAKTIKAANELTRIIEEGGGDIQKTIQLLRQPLPAGVTPTAGQMTGIPVLNALEASLAKYHAKYSGEIRDQGENAFKAYQMMVGRLRDVGTPDAFRKAAEMQSQYFDKLLGDRIAFAHADAAEKIARITKDRPSARSEIGQIVKDNVESALKEARDVESQFWNEAYKKSFKTVKGAAVPKAVNVTGTSRAILDVIDSFSTETYVYDVPTKFKAMTARLGITGDMIQNYEAGKMTKEYLETGIVPDRFLPDIKNIKPFSVPELIKIRSDLLNDARKASTGASPDANMARVYGNVAESILDDLSVGLKSPDYDIARQYSKSLNDTFTRTFAGEMQRTGVSGAEKLPAEILISRAFGRNADLTAMRMDQIEDAAQFLIDQQRQITGDFPRSAQAGILRQAGQGAQQRVSSILDAQARIMRLAAAEAVDLVRNPTTGQIEQRLNTTKLMNWAAENKPMLDKLGITPDLENAEKAENFFELVQRRNSTLNNRIRKQFTFSKVLAVENPTKAVTQALRSSKPLTAINSLTKLAKKGGQDAVDGLKSTIFDYAFTQASNPKTGGMSPQIFMDAMFKPLAQGKPSLYAIMRSQGIMTKADGDNMRALLNPMLRIEREMARGNAVDEIVTAAGPVGDLALRIIGAKVGSTVSQAAGGSGGSLIAASAGSKYMREVFDKMPNASVKSLLEDATKNPTFMADMLESRAQLPRNKLNLARQVHGYLLAQGYTDAPYTIEDVEEIPATPTTGASAASLMRQVKKGPPTTGLPFMSQAQAAPAAPAPQPTAQGPGPAAPASSRQMLQSLFPFDSTLQLPQ